MQKFCIIFVDATNNCGQTARGEMSDAETMNRIKAAGLKLTPRRKEVYEAMMELRHATMDTIIEHMRSKDNRVTVSTIYRILDSFCKAKILSLICRPDTGKCYYDITTTEHHHVFDGRGIVDYDDPELTELIRQHLTSKNVATTGIDKIRVQITTTPN